MKTQFELVDDFAKSMKDELIANEHKGDWRQWKDVVEIGDELQYHLEKLDDSVIKYEQSNRTDLGFKHCIKEHAADCANLLLMLGNAYELY